MTTDWNAPIFTLPVGALEEIQETFMAELRRLTRSRIRWANPQVKPCYDLRGKGAILSVSGLDLCHGLREYWDLEVFFALGSPAEVTVKPPARQYPGWRRTSVLRADPADLVGQLDLARAPLDLCYPETLRAC